MYYKCMYTKLSVPVWVVPMWKFCAEWLYYYLKNKQKLDVSSELGPSPRVSSKTNKCINLPLPVWHCLVFCAIASKTTQGRLTKMP
jgi:hypothetical protein